MKSLTTSSWHTDAERGRPPHHRNPKHDYTKTLLDAALGRDWHSPRLDRAEAERIIAETAQAKAR